VIPGATQHSGLRTLGTPDPYKHWSIDPNDANKTIGKICIREGRQQSRSQTVGMTTMRNDTESNLPETEKILADAHSLWDSGNETRAFALFLQAAKEKKIEAYNNLGYMLDHGLGVEKDGVAAFKWYKKPLEPEIWFHLIILEFATLSREIICWLKNGC
jgi:Sel1 repeat